MFLLFHFHFAERSNMSISSLSGRLHQLGVETSRARFPEITPIHRRENSQSRRNTGNEIYIPQLLFLIFRLQRRQYHERNFSPPSKRRLLPLLPPCQSRHCCLSVRRFSVSGSSRGVCRLPGKNDQ